jgi:hypothetical protein
LQMQNANANAYEPEVPATVAGQLCHPAGCFMRWAGPFKYI